MADQNLTFAGQPTVFNITTYNDPSLCTLSTCPKDYATIEYLPNLGGNTFYLAWFAAFGTIQVILGIYYHTWTYMTAMLGGSILEILGYAARVLMHDNIFNFNWFLMYAALITSFTSIGDILTDLLSVPFAGISSVSPSPPVSSPQRSTSTSRASSSSMAPHLLASSHVPTLTSSSLVILSPLSSKRLVERWQIPLRMGARARPVLTS